VRAILMRTILLRTIRLITTPRRPLARARAGPARWPRLALPVGASLGLTRSIRPIALNPLDAIAAETIREATSLLVSGDLESLARIPVRAAGAPGGAAAFTLSRAATRLLLLMLRRLPETAARKPHQHGIGMTRLKLPERWRQLVARMCSKRGRLPFEDDRPVRVTRRHGLDPRLEPLEFFDQGGALQVQQLRRLPLVALGSFE
jgi:hypothetical protein